MGTFLYTIFLQLYSAGFKLAALVNHKAKLGIAGRKQTFAAIEKDCSNFHKAVVWMHCASLGEFEQGRPLLEGVRQQYPAATIVLTFFSASGYEVRKDYAGADYVYYLPFDSPRNARKLVAMLQPSLVLWVKYEFWYYYLDALKRNQVPVLLVSGIFRNGAPFFKWYGKLWRSMLSCFAYIFVQNKNSLNLLESIGFSGNVMVTGDTRFDRVIEIAEKFTPIPLVEQFCGNSKVIVAGSTWEEDEAELVHYVKANPGIKFIIAPHETDPANLKDLQVTFPGSVFYSSLGNRSAENLNNELIADAPAPLPGSNVLIIDNVGMLSRLYHYADITYVGGGFGADGVHNVLEAAVYGKPVFYGPEFEKFEEAIGLEKTGGGIAIEDALELESELNILWEDENLLAEKGAEAKNFVYANAGASRKIIQVIQEKRLLTN